MIPLLFLMACLPVLYRQDDGWTQERIAKAAKEVDKGECGVIAIRNSGITYSEYLAIRDLSEEQLKRDPSMYGKGKLALEEARKCPKSR